mgnify:CR=1 FL=1
MADLKKEKVVEGFVAFSTDGKMLRNFYTGGQSGTNKQSLTTDVELASVERDKKMLWLYAEWYNKSHKQQKDFTIKKVIFRQTSAIEVVV